MVNRYILTLSQHYSPQCKIILYTSSTLSAHWQFIHSSNELRSKHPLWKCHMSLPLPEGFNYREERHSQFRLFFTFLVSSGCVPTEWIKRHNFIKSVTGEEQRSTWRGLCYRIRSLWIRFRSLGFDSRFQLHLSTQLPWGRGVGAERERARGATQTDQHTKWVRERKTVRWERGRSGGE